MARENLTGRYIASNPSCVIDRFEGHSAVKMSDDCAYERIRGLSADLAITADIYIIQ